MADTWLVVGLGNPGPRYELTRHNVGQMVVDELAARRRESFRAHKANARVVETWLRPGGAKLVLAKPNTFMNVSGGPVAGAREFLRRRPRARRRRARRARHPVRHDQAQDRAAATAATTACATSRRRSARRTSRACGWASAARPGGRIPRTGCSTRSAPTERKNLPILLADAADAVEQLVDEGLLAAQQKHHAPRAAMARLSRRRSAQRRSRRRSECLHAGGERRWGRSPR